ncbi:MAG: hypothetical protein ABS76_27000 [Pelagibacterium sp. SCN 64-44]|nr:MAG: hypothetical protein ABS76_27000 [Pelagibacterium sp. SCN 64-44]
MSEITSEVLMAYADGQLPEAQRASISAHLAANGQAEAEMGLMLRQNDAIKTLFDPVAAEAVPARLRPRRLAENQRRRRTRFRLGALAAILLVGLGVGAGWLARPLFDAPSASAILIANAVNAHSVYVAENRHAVEVGSADSAHLGNWLSSRLETRLGLPDLAPEGFTLMGGRLLPGTPGLGGRAAQLMYEDQASERVTIYVTAALPDRENAYQFTSTGGAEAFYWANARITCTVVGTLPQARMRDVAGAVYAQLTEGEMGAAKRPYRE